MKTVEVLVVTLNQNDFSKYEEMNISTHAIFANQAQTNKVESKLINKNKLKMITTTTVGVGINRNIALSNATGDYIVFADDDVSYIDKYEELILKAFKEVPDADILIFNVEITGGRTSKLNNKIKKVNITNFFPYGTVRIVAKRKAILRSNLWFSHLFGGGALYGSGEDSLFLREAIKKGLKIYTYPEILAEVDGNSSSWFSGYNEKYFYDKGAWLRAAFPKLYVLMINLFAIRFLKRTDYSFFQLRKMMKNGAKGFINNMSYEDFLKKNGRVL